MTVMVHNADILSHISMVFFLSNLSHSAPANILSNTYGAYDVIVSIAVYSAEPLSPYSQSTSA